MSIWDIFRLKKIKTELENLRRDNDRLKSILTPDHQEAFEIKKFISQLETERNQLSNDITKLTEEFTRSKASYNQLLTQTEETYDQKKKMLLVLDEQLMLEDFGLYEPRFSFTDSATYKQQLDEIRSLQKSMIKNGSACSGNTNWTVNNNKTQGKKMVNDMIKLVLRCFNNECDSCVANVKFNNIENFEKRIDTSFDILNKLGSIMQVSLSYNYKQLKLKELYLAHEYQLKKQAEKEEQRAIREQMREEARLQKEIEDARKIVEKEKRHYVSAIEKSMKQLENCTNEQQRIRIQGKIDELKISLGEVEKQLVDIDYREANQRAGYVYIISNIGSFGEGVYKIGMTRRLDPMDRVSELGDASVPFYFDVHAMIFSNDAPKLEAELHRAFESKRLNLINRRKEFFRVTLDAIEQVIKKNHDNSVEFIRTAAAEQYRESQLLLSKQSS